MSQEYRQYYNEMLEKGQEYQDFVADELYKRGISIGSYASKKWQIEHGENRAGIEIKYDMQFCNTRRLWIEISEKSHPINALYVKSGIYRDDNSWLYVIGDYRTIFILPKVTLRLLFEAGRYPERENNSRTSTGFLFPEKDARKYAAITVVL